MVDHSLMKLGKHEPKNDPRTLELRRYRGGLDWQHIPATVDWYSKVTDWPMYDNDKIGDCSCASAGHAVQAFTTYAQGATVVPTVEDVIALYTVTGYDPAKILPDGTNPTDNGAHLLDILRAWARIGLGADRIVAYAAVDMTSPAEVKLALATFGPLYIGVALPVSAQTQEVWAPAGGPDGEPGSWGGHAIPLVGYDADYVYFISWGKVMKMTWGFLAGYQDEGYAVITKDFLDAQGEDPAGLNLSQLIADARELQADRVTSSAA